ncbi:rho guanine nucleotide exchange factor 17-like [Python bivittatus]|uniref:Rho guanine nucleotide exchange factor 17-like n=1 Tax=Python bivittatus TaxID=176946 RepID=A0A9F2WLY5_PYTBI|nr:rho guanine nucleotide exchange factor 17-like [Python bivittatus]
MATTLIYRGKEKPRPAPLIPGSVFLGKVNQKALTFISCSPLAVGSDAIIRQHKAACLRITSLLACKDLLWIGTSAGVVLTLSITGNTAALKTPPLPVGLSQGHTGHVRFLTSIELSEGFNVLFPLPGEPGTEKSSDLEKRDSTRHRSSKSKMLVISGGDGCEDFRLTNSSETVGRDDSTNHLLLWRV